MKALPISLALALHVASFFVFHFFQTEIKRKSREIFDKLDFLGINKKDIRALVLSLIELEVGKIPFSCLPFVYELSLVEIMMINLINSLLLYDPTHLSTLENKIKRMANPECTYFDFSVFCLLGRLN